MPEAAWGTAPGPATPPTFNSLFEMQVFELWRDLVEYVTFNSLFEMPASLPPPYLPLQAAPFNSLFEMHTNDFQTL